MAAPTSHQYPTKTSVQKGLALDVPQVRNPNSMAFEVTIADSGTFTLAAKSSPGVYCVQIKATGATCFFAVGVNATTGAPTIVILCADVIASVGPVVATAWAVASTSGKTSLEAVSTTGLLLRNRSGGTLTYYVSRVV